MPKQKRILGLDCGTEYFGWGAILSDGRSHYSLASGVLAPKGSDPLAYRLCALQAQLRGIFAQWMPEDVAVEAVFTHRDPRAALTLAHARGIALAVAGEYHLSPAEYAPQTVKAAVTGFGHAPKEQVAQMVQALLSREKAFLRNDESDALAVALCHALRGNQPQPACIRRRKGSGWTAADLGLRKRGAPSHS